jgi:hypothetical protein
MEERPRRTKWWRVVLRVLAVPLGALFLLWGAIGLTNNRSDKFSWTCVFWGVLFLAYAVTGWSPDGWRIARKRDEEIRMPEEDRSKDASSKRPIL